MEKYLEECLDSVLAQTLKEIEIICVDDGSTDNSSNILKKYLVANKNIVILTQKNSGSGMARNAGMSVAKGEFIAFMDPDDYYADTDALESLYGCAKKTGCTVCGGQLLCEREGRVEEARGNVGKFFQNRVVKYREYQHICGYTGFIFQNKFLKDNAIFFPIYRRYQDRPFAVNAMIHADTFFVISKPIYVCRVVDKIIHYEDEEVINGIAKGVYEIVVMSKEARYEILHADIVKEMQDNYLGWFYRTIHAGNQIMRTWLQKIWDNIDEKLLAQDGRMTSKPDFKSDRELAEYIDKLQSEKAMLWEQMNRSSGVVIYGAGKMGRRVYAFIKQNNYKGKVGFAVSAPNPSGEVCGEFIQSIDSYLQYKDDVLVLVAVQGDDRYVMLEKAKKLGYKNVRIAPYEDIMLF
ncbi:MAG: glycosyltransferase [Lachnospiraceae bacterium]|nr:glycosyltransferase [Lachnospiraceae bacterium]